MRLKRIVIILLLALTALPAARGENDTYIDERENWDVIVHQFHRSIARYRQLGEDLQRFIDFGLKRFEKQCVRVEKRSSELQFLLWEQSSSDVFGINLYCRQITDLKTAFDLDMERLRLFCSRAEDDVCRAVNLENAMKRINPDYLSVANRHKLNVCRQELTYYLTLLRRNQEQAATALKRGEKIELEVNHLDTLAEEKRARVMRQVIFQHHQEYFRLLPLAGALFRFWFSDVSNWLAVQVPDSPGFWRNLLLLALLVGVPLYFSGHYLFRRIVRAFSFAEKYGKQRIFMTGWGLLVTGGILFTTRFMLGEAEATPFIRLGDFILTLSGLILALGIRVDRELFRRCLWLYLPLMIQHLLGVILGTLLVPYLPLMILMPVLTLPVAAVIVVLLIRCRYPMLDRIFGGLSVAVSILTMVAACNGAAYASFTVMLVWFVLVSGIQTGLALTRVSRSYTAANSHRRIMTCMLFTLLNPVMWMMIVGGIIYWTAGMFSAENLLQRVLSSDLVAVRDVVKISLIGIITAILSGLILQFVLSSIRYSLQIAFGEQAEMGVIQTVTTLGTYLAWGCYVIFVLVLFRVHYSSILVVLGGMSMGLGFGLKEMVENFIGGIILLAGKQVRPGDMIELGGVWGRVRKVSIRATVVDTEENAVITFPNAQILNREFRNWTLNRGIIRLWIKIGATSGSDTALVTRLLFQVVDSEPLALKKPRPEVFLTDFVDNDMSFTLEVWGNVTHRHQLASNIRLAVERIFRENGIALPSPQLEIHCDQGLPALAPAPVPESIPAPTA